MSSDPRNVTIPTADGRPLSGLLFESDTGAATAIVVAGGAGIPCRYYQHFATYLATECGPTLLFDFRGIALSRAVPLAEERARFEDWSELDANAAIAFLRARFPDAQLHAVTHSISAALVLAAGNAALLKRQVLVAPHLGRFADQSGIAGLASRIYYGYLAPRLVQAFGYLPSSRWFLGEDLPPSIALQWARGRHAAIESIALSDDTGRVARLKEQLKSASGQALVLSAEDDPIATELAVRRFLFAAPRLRTIRRILRRSEVNGQRIGHWRYFSRRYRDPYWERIARFLS